MTLLVWILVGLISGLIASRIINKSGESVVWDAVLGIVGAVLGGWLSNTYGMAGVSGLGLYSFFVAFVGAIVVLMSYHFLVRRTR